MAFHFRLMSEDGTDLGPFATSEPDWKPGHRIQRGADDAIEVVRVVAAEEGDDVAGYLVVTVGDEDVKRPGVVRASTLELCDDVFGPTHPKREPPPGRCKGRSNRRPAYPIGQ